MTLPVTANIFSGAGAYEAGTACGVKFDTTAPESDQIDAVPKSGSIDRTDTNPWVIVPASSGMY